MSLANNYHIAVPTAFHENEDLNVDATLEHIRFLKKLGVNSVLLCASTGEQHSLNLSEKIELVENLERLDVSSDFEILFGISSRPNQDKVCSKNLSILRILRSYPRRFVHKRSNG